MSMLDVLHALTLVLVVVALIPAGAHALELPGKLRLTREAYLTVQPIYYPGFTVAGIAEPAAIIASILLAMLTPEGGAQFWLTIAAMIGLIGMHAVYWLMTHPVNGFWLQDEKLSPPATTFFSVASTSRRGGATPAAHWTALRDRWEYSHVARAALAMLSFIVLLVALLAAA